MLLVSVPYDEATPWGSYSKKGKLPHGDACSECLTVTRLAYPTKPWSTLVLRMQTDSEFAAEYQKSREIHGGVRARDFVGQSFTTEAHAGFRCERTFLWMNLADFVKQYGCQPGDIAVPVESLDLGPGVGVQKGVCYLDASSPMRIIKYHDVGGKCSDEFLKASESLRPGQGKELAGWYHVNVGSQQNPKCFSKAAVACSAEEMKERAAGFLVKAKERAEDAKRQKEALQELQPASAGEGQRGAEEKHDSSEEEDDEVVEACGVRAAATAALPAPQGKKLAKQKGTEKAKAKTKAKSKGPSSSAPSVPGSVAGPQDTRSVSSLQTMKSTKSQSEKCMEKVQTWLNELDLRKFLTGEQNKRELNFAKSGLVALESRRPGAAEAVMLAARLELCRKAEDRLASAVCLCVSLDEKPQKHHWVLAACDCPALQTSETQCCTSHNTINTSYR